jgi:Mn2+/Fe2+ NRAMP family transporter
MIFFVASAALVVLIVPLSGLVQVMFMAQVVNCVLLPFVLVFVMRLSADKEIMGPLVSGRFLLAIGWLGTALLVLLSAVLVVTAITGA